MNGDTKCNKNMVKVNLPGMLMKIIMLSETLINYSSLRENLYSETLYSHKQSILSIKNNKENNNVQRETNENQRKTSRKTSGDQLTRSLS